MMRTLILTWMLCCGVANAAEASPRDLPSNDAQAMSGTYTLADGRTLTVRYNRHKLYAQVDDQAEVELEQTGATLFQSSSGDLQLDFKQSANGLVAGVQLQWHPGQARLAANRK